MTTPVTPMTIKQAADHLGLTIWEVREMTERGELPYATLNGRRFVAREDLGPATAGSLMARRFGWNVTETHGIHAEELGHTVRQTMAERGVSMGDMLAAMRRSPVGWDMSLRTLQRRLSGEVPFLVTELLVAATELGMQVSDLVARAERAPA